MQIEQCRVQMQLVPVPVLSLQRRLVGEVVSFYPSHQSRPTGLSPRTIVQVKMRWLGQVKVKAHGLALGPHPR